MKDWDVDAANDHVIRTANQSYDRFNVLRKRQARKEAVGPEYDQMVARMELYNRLTNSMCLNSRDDIIDELDLLLKLEPEWDEEPLDQERARRYWCKEISSLKEHFSKVP
jgi:hypothetical protein